MRRAIAKLAVVWSLAIPACKHNDDSSAVQAARQLGSVPGGQAWDSSLGWYEMVAGTKFSISLAGGEKYQCELFGGGDNVNFCTGSTIDLIHNRAEERHEDGRVLNGNIEWAVVLHPRYEEITLVIKKEWPEGRSGGGLGNQFKLTTNGPVLQSAFPHAQERAFVLVERNTPQPVQLFRGSMRLKPSPGANHRNEELALSGSGGDRFFEFEPVSCLDTIPYDISRLYSEVEVKGYIDSNNRIVPKYIKGTRKYPEGRSSDGCLLRQEPGKYGNARCFEGHRCCVGGPHNGKWKCNTGEGRSSCFEGASPNGCQASQEPGRFGNARCFEGHRCCVGGPYNGQWKCNTGEGRSSCFEGASSNGCQASREPGRFGNARCFEGHRCCVGGRYNGQWKCNRGDGRSSCFD